MENPGKNEVVECPYDSEHKMKYTRLIYHLSRGCEAQAKYGHEFSTCIYNWLHRVPHGLIEEHERNCPDKRQKDVQEDIWTASVTRTPNLEPWS